MTEDIKTEDKVMHEDVTVTTSAKPMQIHFAGDPAEVSFDMEYARKAVNCHEKLVAALKDIAEAPALPWMERAQLYEEIARRALEKAK